MPTLNIGEMDIDFRVVASGVTEALYLAGLIWDKVPLRVVEYVKLCDCEEGEDANT